MDALIKQFLAGKYHLTGRLTPLKGYEDINYLLDTGDKRFVVKISGNLQNKSFIEAQTRLLNHLDSDKTPRLFRTVNGQSMIRITIDAVEMILRVFHYIDGGFLAGASPDLDFYRQLGEFLAELDKKLEGYQDPVLQIQTHSWAPERIHDLQDQITSIRDPETRRVVKYFMMKHREEVFPLYPKLPKSLIHGDANDYNVIIEQVNSTIHPNPYEKRYVLKGLIDFGDMVFSARIHEVSIALSYALMDKENLMEISASLVKGYHKVLPMNEMELSVLYYLIPARLATSLIHSSVKFKENPKNEYHQISGAPAERLIKKWLKINPLLFTNTIMVACGLADPLNPTKVQHDTREKVAQRRQTFSKALSVSYPEPIQMIGSALQYMYSADGITYLDCVNNIPHVGHCHPDVVAAGQKQMSRLNTNTRYIFDSLNEYAKKLLSTFPPSLSKVFFVNSGSAATDLAVRLAKAYTRTDHFIVLDHAYHGNTQSAIALSPYKFNRKGGSGKPKNVTICKLDKSGYQYPDEGKPEQANAGIGGATIFIAESIPGCAGQVMLDKGFLQEQVQRIRQAGGLYIADEVQTGFGRVGQYFWGFELYDVVPDIVILGKPIANGHPMGAVVCSDTVATGFENGMEFFSSFGGNPVSCEIAKSVLDVMEEEKLQKNARLIGDYLLTEWIKLLDSGQLSGLKLDNKTTWISDVRGTGLFLGIELVKNPDSREPDAEAAGVIVNKMKEKGFLLSTDGPFENVIKFKPPMCFGMENARELAEAFTNLFIH